MRPIFKKPLFWFALLLPIILFGFMWRLASRRPRLVGTLPSSALALAVSDDGTQIAAATTAGQIQFWSAREGRWAALPLEPEGLVPNNNGLGAPTLRFSPVGDALVAINVVPARYGRVVYTWSLPRRTLAWSLDTENANDLNVFYAVSDSTRLAARRSLGDDTVFDISVSPAPLPSKPGELARDFPVVRRFARAARPLAPGRATEAMAFSPDGKSLIVADEREALHWRDLASGRETAKAPPLPLPPGASPQTPHSLVTIAPSPDGRFVALCDNTSVALWNTTARTWTRAESLSSNSRSLAWTPDSQRLWTSGEGVQEWSAPDLKPLRQLFVGGPLALSKDGRTLYTRSLAAPGQSSGVFAWNVG